MQNKIRDEQQESISEHFGLIMMFLVIGLITYIIYTQALTDKSETIQLIQKNTWEELSVKITEDLNYDSFQGRRAYTIRLPVSKDQNKYIECKTSKIKPLCQQLKTEQFPSITQVIYYKGFLDESKYYVYLKGIFYHSGDGANHYYEHLSQPPYHHTKLSTQYIHLIVLMFIGLFISLVFSYQISKYKIFPKHFKVKLIVLVFGIWLFHLGSAIMRLI